MEIIDVKNLKARKEHQCGLCLEMIPKGTTYVRSFNKDGGMVWTFKTHKVCEILKNVLWDFCWSTEDYIDSQDFFDGLQKFCRYFICDQCCRWDEQCELDECYCLNKVCEVLAYYDVVYECGWKLVKRDTVIEELLNVPSNTGELEEAIVNYKRVIK